MAVPLINGYAKEIYLASTEKKVQPVFFFYYHHVSKHTDSHCSGPKLCSETKKWIHIPRFSMLSDSISIAITKPTEF